MPGRLKLELNEAQRAELEDLRDHSPQPYLRERAAALLKIAGGISGREVARHRLNRAHWQDTIYEWVKRYQAEGTLGCRSVLVGAASPLFPPEHPDPAVAKEAFGHMLEQAPQAFDQPGTRWSLFTLLSACPWLRLRSLAGLSQLLQRLKIHWKRARYHVHSPDPYYVEKLHTVWVQLRQVGEETEPSVLLFEDEFTLNRHPSLAQAFEPAGKGQPLAELGHKSNYTWRIAAALNVWTGQVVYEQARYMDVAHLTRFYQKLVQAYPQVEIRLIEDNWPIHYHEDLLAALQPQTFPWGMHRPANWKQKARRRIERLNLPIRLLFLPTYASWTNPIEKLWRLLKQEVLHLHRYADDWPGLKQRVGLFLDQFAQGSQQLLRDVGLSDPYKLFQALFPA